AATDAVERRVEVPVADLSHEVDPALHRAAQQRRAPNPSKLRVARVVGPEHRRVTEDVGEQLSGGRVVGLVAEHRAHVLVRRQDPGVRRRIPYRRTELAYLFEVRPGIPVDLRVRDVEVGLGTERARHAAKILRPAATVRWNCQTGARPIRCMHEAPANASRIGTNRRGSMPCRYRGPGKPSKPRTPTDDAPTNPTTMTRAIRPAATKAAEFEVASASFANPRPPRAAPRPHAPLASDIASPRLVPTPSATALVSSISGLKVINSNPRATVNRTATTNRPFTAAVSGSSMAASIIVAAQNSAGLDRPSRRPRRTVSSTRGPAAAMKHPAIAAALRPRSANSNGPTALNP